MLIFKRTEIAQRRMTSDSVVPDFNVFEDRRSNSGFCQPFETVEQFPFQGREKAFRDCIVITVRTAAHTGNQLVLMQQSAIVSGGILDAAIGMMEQSWCYR